MHIIITMIAALLLDRLLGEARRWHPLVGFGRLANTIEQFFYGRQELSPFARKFRGLLALLLLIVPASAALWYLLQQTDYDLLIDIVVLYLAIGARSLVLHARQVSDALLQNRMQDARMFTGYLVSRDTRQMDSADMSRATIESTLENGCDAVFAPLFWFLLAGAPGVLCYRLVNTLDAMWGYRTPRYLHFGWAAARLDDVMNFIPARLTALSYAMSGRFAGAIQCWRSQAQHYKSPNGGPVMAAGAGALALQLGGAAIYHGKRQAGTLLGCGARPQADDIAQALRLLRRSLYLWLAVSSLIAGGIQLA